jgi:hypothetical protein
MEGEHEEHKRKESRLDIRGNGKGGKRAVQAMGVFGAGA